LAADGTLLYIKPSLPGRELADVLNYWKTAPSFPHQRMADQWFDKTLFESQLRSSITSASAPCASPPGRRKATRRNSGDMTL